MTGFLDAPVYGSTGYQIQRSLRLRKAASTYLSRTFTVAGNRTTWSYSTWLKRGELGTSQVLFAVDNSNRISFGINTADSFEFEVYNGAGADYFIVSSALLRDTSAHYHLLLVWDSNNATAADRMRMYVNGVRLLSFSGTGNTVPLGALSSVNTAVAHTVGCSPNNAFYSDVYMADVHFIDGQALTPSAFGQYDSAGNWQAKPYAGSYGTNGFRLRFDNPTSLTTLCADSSGNGNNWTATNVSLTAGASYDSMLDAPLGSGGSERGNYATLNPLAKPNLATTFSEGNLLATVAAGTNSATRAFSSAALPPSGLWYLEAEFSTDTSAGEWSGFGLSATSDDSSGVLGGVPSMEWVFCDNGFKRNNNSAVAYGTSQASVFTLRMAVNANTGKVWVGDATGWFGSGDPVAGTGEMYSGLPAGLVPMAYFYRSTGTSQAVRLNFGQRPFTYTPPSGFKPLHTGNLPDPVIGQPNKHFDVLTYVGNGGEQAVTGLAFQPDFVWMKNRSAAASHLLSDAVRGGGFGLSSDTTAAESASGWVSSFNSNGWTLNVGGNAQVNANGNAYAGWSWKAGGAAVTNNAGSISAQVSANPSAGFSIVAYANGSAGSTIGHGLGVALAMAIIKRRGAGTNTPNWAVYHRALSGGVPSSSSVLNLQSGNVLTLNTTNAVGAYIVDDQIVGAASGYVAYCFAEIPGFSKFGSYTGNGSVDGPFAHCGFRPRFVMVKCSSSASDWLIIDAQRDSSNTAKSALYPDLSNAEETSSVVLDFLSNGFKVRNTFAHINTSGQTYIFAAFAEAPFKTALAR